MYIFIQTSVEGWAHKHYLNVKSPMAPVFRRNASHCADIVPRKTGDEPLTLRAVQAAAHTATGPRGGSARSPLANSLAKIPNFFGDEGQGGLRPGSDRSSVDAAARCRFNVRVSIK
jgi:hypothetical protein